MIAKFSGSRIQGTQDTQYLKVYSEIQGLNKSEVGSS